MKILSNINNIDRLVGYLTEIDPSGSGFDVDPNKPVTGVVGLVFRIAVGAGGFIATILVIMGGIEMLTSAGQPDKIKEGQDIIINALMGLGLLLMAVTVATVFGSEILGLPGFDQFF
ncbi:MAG TPA: hypothetical protein PK957_01395 [Candidatus Dojkabacteria bacterium]|nr:hypothetical protein [Candidatus Dojkabacteria bacterium]